MDAQMAARDELTSRFEMLVAITLAVAALAAAWAAYQAARWAGEEALRFAAASALRTESNAATARGVQQRLIDVVAFSDWLNATANANTKLATFYESRFRPESVPAFRAWRAAFTSGAATAPKTPFDMPQYALAADDQAAALAKQADGATAEANRARSWSDRYVLYGVFFATVLFLAGIAQQLRRGAHTILLGLAIAVCVANIVLVLLSPHV
jgi:hypothetical protein